MDAPFVPQGTRTHTTPRHNMPILARAQLEAIADIISTLPESYRDEVALRFAFRLPKYNTEFLRMKFLKRCGLSVTQVTLNNDSDTTETGERGSLAAGSQT